jgi:hypothetical protein
MFNLKYEVAHFGGTISLELGSMMELDASILYMNVASFPTKYCRSPLKKNTPLKFMHQSLSMEEYFLEWD